MVFWIEVALMAVLSLVLWAWLTWRLLEWFEREVWAVRGPHEIVDDIPPARPPPASVDTVETAIAVGGMVCGACERRISAALARLDGVSDAKADHRAERVSIRYDPERVDEGVLRERIEGCGFRLL